MNNKIKLAVAGAVLSATSIANAGIVIPAGDWTLDVNGNVNAFYNITDVDKTESVTGAIATGEDALGEDTIHGINTGLLPAWLGFTGTTRQNDVDVSFTISFQPNVSDSSFAGDNDTPLNRQAFVTFGDKSWGSIKLGKDLGVFAGDAILNDMTLLGVGGGAASSGNATTLGGIGTGYIYAAWKGQIAYTTPNMNGFEATIAVTNPNQYIGATQRAQDDGTASTQVYQDRLGIEAKASYSWTGDVAGKVWVSGASYDVQTSTAANSYTATAVDVGATITSGNLGLTGYYYSGEGLGTTLFGNLGANGDDKRDSDGGYLQATYVIPTGTKLGLAYGVSNLDKASGEADSALVDSNERWTVGAYHPLTKHLNLVAEYNSIESEAHNDNKRESDTISLGAILFF